MSSPAVVPSLVETTHHVEPERAFEFWRCTALSRFGDIARPRPNERFSAKRLTVAGADWLLTHTISSPIGVTIRPRHVDRSGRDMVVIGLAVDGIGYQEQCGSGAQLQAGDIGFLSRALPMVAGTQSDYEEIRLALPRETFEARIGRVEALAGRSIRAQAGSAAFGARLRAVASAVAWMSEGEAETAIDGALHLLGNLVGGPAGGGEAVVSLAAVESLARAHIARRLHDPKLSPGEIHAVLGVSRSSLYRAFGASGGIEAAIRDIRLDLARRRLEAPRDDRMKIATIAYACGFTDIPAFNRGFRKRFGLSPRDLRAARA
ncbi:helix-turn-helix domain-containing protein [Methylobacterium sp. J-030]|uniref:helix-turn-helix domain-containing protein n=1 Tax=Methylobacterium sp. J-030 TaxID=2836627 RepID=UPI001FB97A87|nr:helix-turn-helix domain-containing protein [Methylobacterium sp. J-030]MCJ2068414.1 helix-turn-helix domain-containing protein [Methylobacterium sp. J-030]